MVVVCVSEGVGEGLVFYRKVVLFRDDTYVLHGELVVCMGNRFQHGLG